MNDENIKAEKALNTLQSFKEISDESLESFFNEVKNIKHDYLNPQLYIEVNQNLGLYYRNKEEYQEAINCLNKSIKKLESNSFAGHLFVNNYYYVLSETYYALAIIFSIQSNYQKAEEYFDKIFFLQLFESQIPYKNDSIYLYQYRKIDKFLLQDFIDKKITLNAVKNFNDPFDSLVYHWLDNNEKKIKNSTHVIPMKNSFNKIRIGCFSGNFKKNIRFSKNILMWSHYADSHKGVCICYKINKMFFNNFINDYNNEILRIGIVNYKQNFSFTNKISVDQSFLTKQKNWEYEKEVRLLYFNSNNSQEYISLGINNNCAIEQIYFGYKCSDQDKKTIKQLFPNICKDAKIDYSENKDIYTSIKFSESN